VARAPPPRSERGLHDRSSQPQRQPSRLSEPSEHEILTLRSQSLTGPAIARQLGRAVSTVGAVLRRRRLGQLRALEPRPPVIRYERQCPGELIHFDIKKLGRIDGIGQRITGDRSGQSSQRGTGWQYLHVAIDDASRLAYTGCPTSAKKARSPSLPAPSPGSPATALGWNGYERQRLGI
jgi:hypothetical protein